jgi:hypothetical protein
MASQENTVPGVSSYKHAIPWTRITFHYSLAELNVKDFVENFFVTRDQQAPWKWIQLRRFEEDVEMYYKLYGLHMYRKCMKLTELLFYFLC